MAEAVTTPTSTPAAGTPPPAAPVAAKVDATPAPAKVEPGKQPTAAEIRKLKLKLDGQDFDLPEEEVIKLAQQAGAAGKRFQEAAAMRKQAEQVLEILKSNPKEGLKRLGIDLRKFSEETLVELIKQDQESPEQKELREYKEKTKKYEEQEKTRAEADKKKAADDAEVAQKRANEEKEKAIVTKYRAIFDEAIKEAGIPLNKWTYARMATLQRINLKNKMGADAGKLAKIVKEDYDAEFNARLPRGEKGELDGSKLLEMFGPDVIKAIKKASIANWKSKQAGKFSTPNQPTTPAAQQQQPGQHKSWADLRKKNRSVR